MENKGDLKNFRKSSKYFKQNFHDNLSFVMRRLLLIIDVRTQFVTTHNNVGFARKKAPTISFIERGFERLDLGHRTVVYRGVHTELNRVRSRSLSPGGGLGGSGSWPFFPATFLAHQPSPYIALLG